MEIRVETRLNIGDLVEGPIEGEQRLLKVSRIAIIISEFSQVETYRGVSPLDYSDEPLEYSITEKFHKVTGSAQCKNQVEWVLNRVFRQDESAISTRRVAHLVAFDGSYYVTYFPFTGEIRILNDEKRNERLTPEEFLRKIKYLRKKVIK